MQGLPEITLDTTLGELYARGCSPGKTEQVALVLCAANSEISPSSKLARNVKYLYQDSTFSSTPPSISSKKEKEIQRSVAIKYLSLVPQHDAFAAGNMPVVLFNLDNSGEATTRSQEEAQKTIDVLTMDQRPKLIFVPSPHEIRLQEHQIDRLVAKMELDELEDFPLAVSLDVHYFLNSKAALSESGLPSSCKSNDNSLAISSSCTGARGKWLKAQVDRALSRISTHRVPFVFKNQQTFGGGGTYVISSPEDLSELTNNLSTLILPKLFSQVNQYNAHLKPATLILSDLIADPVNDWGLTFFVTRAGESVFLAATRQVVDSTKAWIGSTISYTLQESLKQKFSPIMREIGSWLHKYDYYGPCGADILETNASKGTDDGKTTLTIVDLNVRTSGSLVLGLMKGHFSDRRSLPEATSFSVSVEMGRDSFIEAFEDQFRDGRMVIVSWYQDGSSGISYGNVLIGAQDTQELEEMIGDVKKLAPEIHF